MSLFQEFIQHEGLEYREAQEKMAFGVERSIKERIPSFIEGGTGNGKTFAYLVKLIDYLHHNPGKKAVISTATILLQDQLIKKDIPRVLKFFKAKYGEDFTITMADVTKLIGSRNYVCEDDPIYSNADSQKLNTIKSLLGEENFKKLYSYVLTAKKNGTQIIMRDLDFNIPAAVRNEIGCKGIGGCKCYDKKTQRSRRRCAYRKNIELASDARIIIVNHNYLSTAYSAIANRDIVIIDEAHKLPEVLSNRATSEINLTPLIRLCDNVIRYANDSVLFPSSSKKIDEKLQNVRDLLTPFIVRLKNIENAIDNEFKKTNLFAIGNNVLDNVGIEHKDEIGIFNYLFGWAKDPITTYKRCENAICELRDTIMESYDVEDVNNKKSKNKKNTKNKNNDNIDIIKEQLSTYTSLIRFFEKIGSFRYPSPIDCSVRSVIWFERGVKSILLMKAPVDKRIVQKKECEKIIRSGKIPIFVSATLSLSEKSKDFSYFKKELGLDKLQNTVEIKIPSSFDWARQTQLIIPMNMPQPNFDDDKFNSLSGGTQGYYQTVAKSICDTLPHIDGNALVLCSSVYMTDYIAKYLEQNTGSDILILNQADGLSIERMVNEMRKGIQPKKVLVGMQMLWQGVDLPGEALRGLFIVKFPFQAPNHPLIQARQDEMKKEKKSYFYEVMLPEATILTRQGVGRLIRGKDPYVEYGTIVIYDPRLSIPEEKQKFYFKKMMNDVFPKEMLKNARFTSVENIPVVAKDFFDSKRKEVLNNKKKQEEQEDISVKVSL